MGAPEPLSNATPDVAIAVHVHRVHVALTAERLAKTERRLRERQAESAGVPIGGVRRARHAITADPDRLERQERETAVVLRATRAGVQMELPGLQEQTTDQSDAARDKRLHDEGYSAAVWCYPRDGGGYDEPEDAAAWFGGFDAFEADRAAFDQAETKTRERK